MGSQPSYKPDLPWYRNYDYWVSKANEYLLAAWRVPHGTAVQKEMDSFQRFNWARVIFESNLIEGAGMPSEGDTRKVIDDCFPEIPSSYSAFRALGENPFARLLDADALTENLEGILGTGLSTEEVFPSVAMAGKSRQFIEVARHYHCLWLASHFSLEHTYSRLAVIISNIVSKGMGPKEYLEEGASLLEAYKSELGRKRIVKRKLLTEGKIRELHKIIAGGLLPSDAGVPAGEYRIDNRSVGWDIAFPGPDLVPASMKAFISTSQKATEWTFGLPDHVFDAQALASDRLFDAAAQVSYDFVRIHPFPDFNGRLSRVTMNMVFQSCGCIPISIRGHKKGRRRYFSALKRANRGDIKPLAALIAIRVAETYGEIDDNLTRAGQPTILEAATM
jgi:fido (protein-threonine AMPylation protein)